MVGVLRVDRLGRTVVVCAAPSLEFEVGQIVGVVVGDTFRSGPDVGCYFLEKERAATRRATARERGEAARFAPYDATRRRRERGQHREVDDEALDEAAALEACRLEQQRTPPDLISRVAA